MESLNTEPEAGSEEGWRIRSIPGKSRVRIPPLLFLSIISTTVFYKSIVSASRDKTVRVWSAATGECVQTLAGHSGQVYWAQFSPDGQSIVSASRDGTVRVWSAATGECAQTLAGHSGAVYSAQFNRQC